MAYGLWLMHQQGLLACPMCHHLLQIGKRLSLLELLLSFMMQTFALLQSSSASSVDVWVQLCMYQSVKDSQSVEHLSHCLPGHGLVLRRQPEHA